MSSIRTFFEPNREIIRVGYGLVFLVMGLADEDAFRDRPDRDLDVLAGLARE